MVIRLKSLIAKWEEERGEELTYKRIAADTGLHVNTIGNLASGSKKQVHFETIAKLCEFFNVTPSDLIEVVDRKPPSNAGRGDPTA